MRIKGIFLVGLLVQIGCQNTDRLQQKITPELDLAVERTKLRHLKEVEWPQAYREQDTVLLDRILGDDFRMVAADGSWSDKAGQMKRIKSAPMKHDFFEYEIKRLELFENGTAIIAGTGHIINDDKEMIYQSSNVLIKRGNLWKAVLSHVSGITALDQPHSYHVETLPREAEFSYLSGDWKRSNEVAGKATYEHWKKISDTEYKGLGYTLVARDTVWKEDIRLSRSTDHWDYEVLGQGDSIPTPFKVVKADKYGFECYNPVNEFPKTIRYERQKDTLYAVISDGETQIAFTFTQTAF